MSVFVVDTNILIYAADRDSPENARCHRLLGGWRSQTTPWYLTWGIVYEFLRVATHPQVFAKPLSLDEAWRFMDAVLSSPSLGFLVETDRHRHVIQEVFAEIPGIKGNLVFDAHTAILMRENGIKTIYTHDADFNRFAFLDVIDPIADFRRSTPLRRG